MVEQWKPVIIQAAGEFAKTLAEQVMTARAQQASALRVNQKTSDLPVESCVYCSVAKHLIWAQRCIERGIEKQSFRSTYNELARIALEDAMNIIRRLPSELRRAELQMHVGRMLGHIPLYGLTIDERQYGRHS